MTWKQYMRHAQAAARRSEREAIRQYRELERRQRQYEKEARRQAAVDEVERYEGYVRLLVTIHNECGDPWIWPEIVTTTMSPPPSPVVRNEQAARAMLDAYQPGFFDKLLGGAKKRRAELEQLVEAGRQADQREYTDLIARHQALAAFLERSKQLAPGVIALELRACRDALALAGAFDELTSFGASVALDAVADGAAFLQCTQENNDVIPKEEVKLTAGGKMSTKEMAAGKYWSLYQDHVCSCAIRIARETFATLPIRRSIVNIGVVRLNPSNGHMEPQTVLGVHFTREQLAKLRLDSIDPSESMKNFPHRMKFKKSTGLETVQPLTLDEQWVTT